MKLLFPSQIWLIIIFFLFISCSNIQQKFHTNPDSYIVNQLANKRIIMLGDFSHSSPLPYKSLVSLLEEWLKEIRNSKSKDYNIVLALEADTQEVSILKQFLSTGKWKPLFDFWLPYNSMEWLEFCANLKSFTIEIEKLNERKNFPKINFDILGGESSNIFDHPEFLRYSKLDGSKYFINTRDSISAQIIISYLNKNKNRKAIIFYGNLHLIKNYVSKNIAGALPDSEAYGYYLAHYLKQEYGGESVLSINQYVVNRQMIKASPFSAVDDSNIFVYSQDIPWKNIQPQNYDGFILRHERGTPGHSLANVFSINVIDADIKKMQFIEKYLPGYLAEGYYSIAKRSLQLLTGQNFKTVSEWQSWVKNNKYDGLLRLGSKEFENEIFNLYYNNPTDVQIKLELFTLGFGQEIASRQLSPKSEWERVWKDAIPKIKYLNNVGIYWVGTAEEKQKAKKYLDDFIDTLKYGKITGPEDYLKLYREMFEKVNY